MGVVGRAAPAANARALSLHRLLLVGTACAPAVGGLANLGTRECRSRFEPPAQGSTAVSLNGVRLPDVCINSTGSHEVFIIGDWGGVVSGTTTQPADRRNTGKYKRDFVVGLDDVAQQKVAHQMIKRANQAGPDYVLNVGDNFYWGGVDTECCRTRNLLGEGKHNFSVNQWDVVFEDMYGGLGLDGKQWLGVLGNHDYGGFMFTGGWDQTIMYTWKQPNGGKPMRWMTPALYWTSTVRYPDFSVDYFFVDSNHVEAIDPMDMLMMGHNICSYAYNPESANCAAEGGPKDVNDCVDWFRRLWQEQREWLEMHLAASEADWQVVVTHFPPEYDEQAWKQLCEHYGIDLFVTGHIHSQYMLSADNEKNIFAPTVYVVSGGGGGITADGAPSLDGDDQYGFMHMTMSKEQLLIVNIDHNGDMGQATVVQQRECKRCKQKVQRTITSQTQTATELPQTATTTAKASVSELASLNSSHPNTSEAASRQANTTTESTTEETSPRKQRNFKTHPILPPTPVPTQVTSEFDLQGALSLQSSGTQEQVERAAASALAIVLGIPQPDLLVAASRQAPIVAGRLLSTRSWQVGFRYHARAQDVDAAYDAAMNVSANSEELASALSHSFKDLGLSFETETLTVAEPSKQASVILVSSAASDQDPKSKASGPSVAVLAAAACIGAILALVGLMVVFASLRHDHCLQESLVHKRCSPRKHLGYGLMESDAASCQRHTGDASAGGGKCVVQ